MLAQKRVSVDGVLATDIGQIIHRFSVIAIDDELIQENVPVYIMLHKPVGVVCATVDNQHTTVLDLLRPEYSEEMLADIHIVGRLDLNTSGLVLLTNDSRWSEAITSPEHKVAKVYHVTLKHKLTTEYIDAFAQGMYFSYEDISTRPAQLTILSDNEALVSLTEGRYHQIKRMFGRFRNAVIALHRLSVGDIALDPDLAVGEYRHLTEKEVNSVISINREIKFSR